METRGSVTQSMMVEGEKEIIALGSCSHDHESSAMVRPERTSLVMDGYSGDTLAMETVGGQVELEALSTTMEAPGAFSFLAISEGKVLAGRDPLGQKPLYYGGSWERGFVFASSGVAVKKTGIKDPRPVPPGMIIAATANRVSVLRKNSLSRPKEAKISETEASSKLKELLIESLSEAALGEAAIAFSGGLDSTLVAYAARENDSRPALISVGLKGQAELDHSRRVAKKLGSDITVRELSEQEVLDSLPDVVRVIESTDPVLVGVSVPLHFVCQVAQEMDMENLLAGQLSDELFGGYGRFEDLAMKRRWREARTEVWNSVLAASTRDFEPGDKLAVAHKLELRCPFAYLPLVQYALQVPISLKLRVVRGAVVRKYILRRLAADWKLPDSVVNRAKKAVQYSTGVQRVLVREAKRRRLTLSRFLESLREES